MLLVAGSFFPFGVPLTFLNWRAATNRPKNNPMQSSGHWRPDTVPDAAQPFDT